MSKLYCWSIYHFIIHPKIYVQIKRCVNLCRNRFLPTKTLLTLNQNFEFNIYIKKFYYLHHPNLQCDQQNEHTAFMLLY